VENTILQTFPYFIDLALEADMPEFTYPVFAFRQQNEAPVQVAFVAPSGEILQWAGVPRKSDELLTGYQRFCDPNRVNQEIVPFFQDPKNCSPTAVILALRKDSGAGRCVLELEGTVETGKIVSGKLIITLDVDDANPDRLFTSALEYVNSRLGSNGQGSDAEPEAEEEPVDDDVDGEADDEEGGEGEQAIHLGSETLLRMKRMLEEKENWDKTEFRKAITDYVKPAFLIDGQHRVTGAARLGLPFIVCGLFDAPWEEQVFQFTVVNLKPRKIPPNTITSIAALSLTRAEQSALETRLEAAGVKMWEVTLMSHVSFDKASPFVEKVDMAVGGPGSGQHRLGYGSMKRVAAVWYRCKYSVLIQVARIAAGTSNSTKARRDWQRNDWWFQFFCAFWQTVRDHYPEKLWQKTDNNRLFNGATLWALQEAILLSFNSYPPSFWAIPDDLEDEQRVQELEKKIKEAVGNLISYIPEDIWTSAWAKSGQDTTTGRDDLVKLFTVFINRGTSSDRKWKGWRSDPETKIWFTGT
jgi:hypothetical protein